MILAAVLYSLVALAGFLWWLDAWLVRRALDAQAKRNADLDRDAAIWAPGRDANAAAPWRD